MKTQKVNQPRSRLVVRLPRLHPAQWQVANDKSRFRVAACGRRFGKTLFAAGDAVKVAGQGGMVWWVAPTFEVTRRGWNAVLKMVRQIPGCEIHRGVREVVFPSGGTIGFKTADSPVGLRGEGLDLVILDEAAYIKADVWWSDLRPALSDKLGRALFISTPVGQNWFWELWRLGQDLAETEWASWQFPTSANPFILPSEIEAARQMLPRRIFQQEYMAEFLSPEGAMFRREWFEVLPVAPAVAHRIRYWDKAATQGAGDFTVGLRMARTSDGLFVIEDVVRGQWSPGERDKIMLQTARLDGPDIEIVVEREPGSSGVDSIVHTIKMLAGYSVKPDQVTGNKVVRAGPLSSYAESGNIKLVRGSWNKDFLDEITGFPGGEHDDQVDAASGAFNKLAEANRVGISFI